MTTVMSIMTSYEYYDDSYEYYDDTVMSIMTTVVSIMSTVMSIMTTVMSICGFLTLCKLIPNIELNQVKGLSFLIHLYSKLLLINK